MLVSPNNFKKHLSNEACKHGVIDQRKYKKWASELKLTEKWYHLHDDVDVAHKGVLKHLIQTIFRHFHFVVHTQNHMVLEGLLSIIICNFIQN